MFAKPALPLGLPLLPSHREYHLVVVDETTGDVVCLSALLTGSSELSPSSSWSHGPVGVAIAVLNSRLQRWTIFLVPPEKTDFLLPEGKQKSDAHTLKPLISFAGELTSPRQSG